MIQSSDFKTQVGIEGWWRGPDFMCHSLQQTCVCVFVWVSVCVSVLVFKRKRRRETEWVHENRVRRMHCIDYVGISHAIKKTKYTHTHSLRGYLPIMSAMSVWIKLNYIITNTWVQMYKWCLHTKTMYMLFPTHIPLFLMCSENVCTSTILYVRPDIHMIAARDGTWR